MAMVFSFTPPKYTDFVLFLAKVLNEPTNLISRTIEKLPLTAKHFTKFRVYCCCKSNSFCKKQTLFAYYVFKVKKLFAGNRSK